MSSHCNVSFYLLVGKNRDRVLIYQQMARVGILISQYIEIAGLNQDADGVYHGGDALFLIFQTFEILFVELDGRGYILSGNHLLLLLVLEHHIVSNLDGWGEILIGNGIEGRSPLGVVFYRIIEKNAFRFVLESR